MKILIIHTLKEVKSTRRTILNFSFPLLKYAPEHEYYLHSYGDPVTKQMINEKFDAIILSETFLARRFEEPENASAIFKKYGFLKNHDAVKIALPQDDYNRSGILAKWLEHWGVNAVFSPCYDYKETLYPSLMGKIDFYKSLTGYIDSKDIDLLGKYSLPLEQRTVDVGFRSNTLAAYFGRHGKLKSDLSKNFLEALNSTGKVENLNIDVSNEVGKTLYGENWFRFLGNSKFTLGCESGSSIMDAEGLIREKVEKYTKSYPEASFEEIESACFLGEDKYKFSAISPRIFETALARSGQILIQGEYLDLIAGEDYIELKADFSNIAKVFEQMQDIDKVKSMIESCYQKLVGSQKYTYQAFAQQQLDVINHYRKLRGFQNENKSVEKSCIEDIETVIDIVVKPSNILGYSYIPTQINLKNLINTLNNQINNLELLENKIHLRSGKLGAIREFLDLNKNLEYED